MSARYMISEVSRMLDVKAHKITYAIAQGMVPEPEERFNRVRVFKDEDVQRLREYFQLRRRQKAAKKDLSKP